MLICLIFCNFTVKTEILTDSLYHTSMDKALIQLDSVKNVSDLFQCRNLFERIAQKYTDNWQPVYYTAYCDIEMVYYDQKSEQNKGRLEDAKIYLEKLASYSEADKSEISTLWGYYYNALILLDPEVNGQKYFGEVIGAYEKAMEQNPENPRPVVLLTFFEQYLPPFIKSKRDPARERERAKDLFDRQTRTIENPYWGKYFLQQITK